MINIGWIKVNYFINLIELANNENWIVGEDELHFIYNNYPHLFFAAFDGDKPIGFITAVLHEKSSWIGNFIVKPDYRNQGVGKRLFKTLMKALKLENRVIYLNANIDVIPFYAKFGFQPIVDICRFELNQKININLSSNIAQELEVISSKNYYKTVFDEDRDIYLNSILSKSSLNLSTNNGFLHSKAIGKNIVVMPWIVKNGAYFDAEKLIRGLIYFRNGKKIVMDVPSINIDAKTVITQYNFVESGKTTQMVLGNKLNIRYDNIYAMPSLGAYG